MELSTTFYLTITLALVFYIFVRKSNIKGPNGAIYHAIDSNSVKEWQDEREKFYLVDVRTPIEYNRSHIVESINIPVSKIKDVANNSFKNKDEFIVIYCQSGSRSRKAARTLIKMGYSEVYDLGSINNWPYKKEK